MSSLADCVRQLGGAYRDDYSGKDGRDVKAYMWDIADELEKGKFDPVAFREYLDLCPAGHEHWTMHCSEDCDESSNDSSDDESSDD